MGLAERILVLGLTQVRVQQDAVFASERGRLAHEFGCHRERRAGRQCNLHECGRIVLVIGANQPFALGQDHVAVLHDMIWRQTTSRLAEAHRPASQDNTHAEFPRDVHLDVDRVGELRRKQIMMIAGRRAARQHELGESQSRCQPDGRLVESRPYRVQRLEPGEQFPVKRRRTGARERLVEMMMTVDKPRKDDEAARIQFSVDSACRPLASRESLRNKAVFDNQPIDGGACTGPDCQRVPDPGFQKAAASPGAVALPGDGVAATALWVTPSI